MFQFELKKAEPSQELFTEAIFCLFLVGLAAMGISSLIDTIKEKFRGKRPLDERITEHYKDINEDIDVDLSEYSENDYPRIDWTDSKNGKHWEIDKQILEDSKSWEDCGNPLEAEDFVEIDIIVPFFKKYLQYLQFLNTIVIGPDTIKKIGDRFAQIFGKSVKTDKNGISGVELKKTKVIWPNSAWFKTPEACAKQIISIRKEIAHSYQSLASKVKRLLNESEDGKTKEYLQGKLALLKACESSLSIDDCISEYWYDGIAFKLNNDEVFGSCLVLKDKDGNDITDHH